MAHSDAEVQEELRELHQAVRKETASMTKASKKLRELKKLDSSAQDEGYKLQLINVRQQIKDLSESINELKIIIGTLRSGPSIAGQQQQMQRNEELSFRSGKLPNDLLKFDENTTELETFFRDTEAKLLAHSTPKKDWHKALGKQTSGSNLLWVTTNILEPRLEWEAAKKVFLKEFSGRNALSINRAKLLDLRQEKRTAGAYLREVELLAPFAQQSLEERFFLDFILRHGLRPKVYKQICLQLGPRVDEISFAELKATAVFLDSIHNSSNELDQGEDIGNDHNSPYTNKENDNSDNNNNQQAPGTNSKIKCKFEDCGSTSHTIQNCPKRLALTCSYCHKKGHTESTCKSKERNKNVKCHKCHQLGHYANNCPLSVKAETAATSSSTPTVGLITVPNDAANHSGSINLQPTAEEISEVYEYLREPERIFHD